MRSIRFLRTTAAAAATLGLMLAGSAAVAGPLRTEDGVAVAGLPDDATPSARGGVSLQLEQRAGTSVAVNAYWWLEEFAMDGTKGQLFWDFGDGTTETTTASPWIFGEENRIHTYSAPGTYTVTVTILGSANTYATGSRSITVGNRIALASFAPDRATATFTDPEVGGPWVTSKNTRPTGFFLPTAGVAESAYLMNTWVRDVDEKVSVRFQSPDEGRTMFTLAARHQVDGHYAVKATYDVNAMNAKTLRLTLTKTLDNVETALATVSVPSTTGFDQTYAGPAEAYRQGEATLRLQVTTENGKTVLKAKIWQTNNDEPAAWNVTATDNDSRLQREGQVGIGAYLSPVTKYGDNLTVLVGQFEATKPGGFGS